MSAKPPTLTRRLFTAAAASTLAAPFVIPAARAQATHSWRIQGYLPAALEISKEFAGWAEGIAEKSDGELTIETLPVGAVVGPTETLDAMRSGILTGHLSGPPYFAGKDPAFAIVGDTSAAYVDVDQRDGWWENGGGNDFMSRLYASHGAHYVRPVFSLAEWMPSKVPLNGVDDLDGLKMRAPQGLVAELFGKFGVGVVVLPGSEVFNALQSGLIDATDWAWLDLNDVSGLFRLVNYAIYAPHSMGVTEFSVSQRAWDRLSDDLKALVETEVAAFSDHLKALLTEREAAAEARVQEAGVTLIRWPESERAKIRAAQVEIWNDMATRTPFAAEAVQLHRDYMATLGL